MEVVHRRCAGIDISKKDAKVCVRVQGWGRRATTASVTTWGAMSNEILALREHLVAEKVTCVAMESTGDYWKPFYYLLEDAVNVMLVNPRDARNRAGRKTDVSDAAWLADLGAHGLLRASLVPPPPIRRLRDLTRARTDLNRDRVPVGPTQHARSRSIDSGNPSNSTSMSPRSAAVWPAGMSTAARRILPRPPLLGLSASCTGVRERGDGDAVSRRVEAVVVDRRGPRLHRRGLGGVLQYIDGGRSGRDD